MTGHQDRYELQPDRCTDLEVCEHEASVWVVGQTLLPSPVRLRTTHQRSPLFACAACLFWHGPQPLTCLKWSVSYTAVRCSGTPNPPSGLQPLQGRVFPFRNAPWRPLALAEVSAELHDAISSRAVSTDSYCLRTERMAWVRTVHLVGQRGFKLVNLPSCSDFAMSWKINLNLPD